MLCGRRDSYLTRVVNAVRRRTDRQVVEGDCSGRCLRRKNACTQYNEQGGFHGSNRDGSLKATIGPVHFGKLLDCSSACAIGKSEGRHNSGTQCDGFIRKEN
jgi:hypothetical protein